MLGDLDPVVIPVTRTGSRTEQPDQRVVHPWVETDLAEVIGVLVRRVTPDVDGCLDVLDVQARLGGRGGPFEQRPDVERVQLQNGLLAGASST